MILAPAPAARKGLVGRVLGAFSRKESQTWRAVVAFFSGRPYWSPKNYFSYANEGYGKNVYVYAAIQRIATACSGIPLVLYKRGASATRQRSEIEAHPILDLLRKPNPWQSGIALCEAEVAFYLIAGNAYTEKVTPTSGPNRGRAYELYTHRPDRIAVVPGTGKNLLDGYEYRVNLGASDPIRFDAEHILHLKAFSPINDWYGLGGTEAASRSIDQNNEGRAWNVGMLQNAAMPSGALQSEHELSIDQRNLLKGELDEMSGPTRAARPLLLDGGLKWQEMGLKPVDMAWIEGGKLSAAEIGLAYGVPPEMLGIQGHRTFANYSEARKSFYQETILPLMERRIAEYQRFVVDAWDDRLELVYDKDSIEAIRDDRKMMFDMAVAGWNAGILTKNEARRMVGEDDDPEGDEYRAAPAPPIGAPPAGGSADGEKPTPPKPPDAGEKPPKPEAPAAGEKPEAPKPAKSKARHRLVAEEDKAAEWKRIDTARSRWVATVRKTVASRFDDERKRVVSAARNAKTAADAKDACAAAVRSGKAAWTKALTSAYMSVGRAAARRTTDSIKAQVLAGIAPDAPLSPAEVKFLAKSGDDVWSQAVEQYVSTTTGAKIQSIEDTTLDQIRSEVQSAIDDGDSPDVLAASLDSLYLDEIIPNRTDVIARTETGTAAEAGSFFAAKATGLDLKKQWLATRDDRTRDDHSDADGQEVAMDDAFEVGGEQMLFPLDSSMGASAGNTIQCRCAAAYVSANDSGDEE